VLIVGQYYGAGTGSMAFACTIAGILVLYCASRCMKHTVTVDGDVVTYRQYRYFGVLWPTTSVFHLRDLGAVVMDGKRRCFGWTGFTGVYVTLGLTRPGESPRIAFEIPRLFNVGVSSTSYHRNTFFSLARVFRFSPPYHKGMNVSSSWSSLTASGSGTAMTQGERSTASKKAFVCFNPALLSETPPEIQKESVHQRAVFYVSYTNCHVW
jgi:hypothetical protein